MILGDEPTASLDPTSHRRRSWASWRRINRERRLTLVVSQHQLETALEYGTRIVGFRAGASVRRPARRTCRPPWSRRSMAEEAA